MPTEIIVRGSFSARRPPERGTVHATVAHEGPAMEPVYGRVVADLEALTSSIDPLHDADRGPVTRWSTDQLRTWSDRPWNPSEHSEGKPPPLVHHASIGIAVRFNDFTELSRWVGTHVVDTTGFHVSHVAWELTEERHDALVHEVHTGAVHDAVARAQRYADALGLGAVRPVAIADAGMLGFGPSGDGPVAMRAMAMKGGAPQIELVPADIEVVVSVDARFHAGAA